MFFNEFPPFHLPRFNSCGTGRISTAFSAMAPATGTRRHTGHDDGCDGCSKGATEKYTILQGLHGKHRLDVIQCNSWFWYVFVVYIHDVVWFGTFICKFIISWYHRFYGGPMCMLLGIGGLALSFYHAQKSAASVLHKAILQLRLVQAQNLFITSCFEKWTSAIWFRILATASRYLAEEVLRARHAASRCPELCSCTPLMSFSAADLQRSKEFLVIYLQHIIECWSWTRPKSSK